MQLPARSTVAAGICGLIAWGISLACAHFGYNISPDVITPTVLAIAVLVSHFVPDSLKDQAQALNVKVTDLAAWIPDIQATYPDENRRP